MPRPSTAATHDLRVQWMLGGADADGGDRLAQRHDDQRPMPLGEVRRGDLEPAADAHHQRRQHLDGQRRRPQQVGRQAAGQPGHQDQQRRAEVDRDYPDDVPVHPVIEPAVHAHHDQVTEAEEDAARADLESPNPFRMASPTTRNPAMPTQQEQPLRGPVRGAGIGQPGVSAVHPPQHPEHQQHLDDRGGGQAVAVQQRGQLGQGEREDQVEEQFQRADPQRRAVRAGSWAGRTGAGASRQGAASRARAARPAWAWLAPGCVTGPAAPRPRPGPPRRPGPPAACSAMSWRYQPPRSWIWPAAW